ncbi:MAG: DUF3471 domain-containing protein [Sphingobacteriaceae bacterium]|nr:MAG: DUF3471 domain-containing protein [Sphingobacteriaceae bacterium]
MKTYLTLALLLVFFQNGFCKPVITIKKSTNPCRSTADSLAAYTGKYQKDFNGTVFYLSLSVENGELVGTQLWDNQKLSIKHLSGDNFIVSGLDWSVKFIRDKEGKVTQVVVMGKDTWTRVKS